ncbi:Nucleic acid-binding OB-fold [Penicillium vulpinum]|uniref:Nucleic acid-binding OB-fold n=1 Tax=Penicillium vulpinum TaxID=29845 RepID=UPI0025482D1D|nr:Nucleic acid-binding OB-fold [Penicillium vulpinum]KAJ5960022.1 Nucleic acid-binding OB-fold [Penicillium vulpinum]
MGYYDDEGNYHSDRRAPENQLILDVPQVLPRRTTSERVSHYDDEQASEPRKHDGNSDPPLPDKGRGIPDGYQASVPIPCNFIRIGDVLILNERPCQVIRILVNPQTGQYLYMGVDLFTRKLHQERSFVSNPSPDVIVQTMSGPVFRTYRLLDMDSSDGTVVAMTETGDVKLHLPVMVQESLFDRIEEVFKEGRGSIRVLVISEMGTGREMVIDYKRIDRKIRTEADNPSTTEADESEDESDDIEVEVYAFFTVGEQSEVRMTAGGEETQKKTSPDSVKSFPSDSTVYDVHPIEFQGETGVNFQVENAKSIPGLPDSEQRALDKLLQRVKKEYDHEPSSSTTDGYMKPGHLTETFPYGEIDTGVVSWLCLPYFRFDLLHNDLNAFTDSYPMRRLLKDLLLKPEQEMKQVMSHMQSTETGKCLHVAQLWAIEMNNSLLVTYGDLELSDFKGIKLQSPPPSQTAQPPRIRPRKIFVSFEKRVMWSLPLEDCITWPIVFTHEGKPVDSVKYADLINGELDIKLVLNISEGSEIPFSELNGGFTVFEWLTEVDTTLRDDDNGSDHRKGVRIRNRLAAMDKFLQDQKFDSRSYRRASLLDSDAVRGLFGETEPATSRAMRTAQAAESIYSFFLPPDFEDPVLKKYWGAVYFLIEEETGSIKGYSDQLIDLSMRIQPVKLLFSRTDLIKRPTDKSSHPLEKAWMHLLMPMIYVKQKPRRSRKHMNTCLGLLDLGIAAVKDTFPKLLPQKSKVILPLDVATLIGFHLLGKQSPGIGIELILNNYTKYLGGLVSIRL